MSGLLSDDINDFCFFDTETRANPDLSNDDHRSSVTTAGAYLYARHSFVTILTYGIGMQPIQLVALPHFNKRLTWSDMPQDLKEFYIRAENGKAWFAAWNTAFDRQVLNQMEGVRGIRPEMTIDVMAQAVASNLPASLEGAARVITGAGKQEDGKALIAKFATPHGETPQTDPVAWDRFCSYGVQDTDQLRNVFLATRPLPRSEWEEYWASEHVNDRGIALDIPFAERAAAIAAADTARTNAALRRLTGGDLRTITQHVALAEWVYDRIEHAEARDMLVKAYDEDSEDDLAPAKLSLERARVEALIVFFEALDDKQGLTDDEWNLLQILQLRQFGASNTPKKFAKMVQQVCDGRLRGQYVWNGANQTGRFCVSADTVIDTPQGGRYIVDLRKGDVVKTLPGASGLVTDLIFKGREDLYLVVGPRGEFVKCTLAHRFLTFNGWRSLGECIEKAADGSSVLRGGCEPLSLFELHHGADSGAYGNLAPHSFRSAAQRTDLGGTVAPPGGDAFAQQDGDEEPHVRGENGFGPDFSPGLRGGVERGGLHLRAPGGRGEVSGSVVAARPLGSPPHRWGQAEQRFGQPSCSYEVWASKAAQEKTWFVVPLGEGEVWDISVEGDACYSAGGIVHHNSSRGVQIHNLVNKTLATRGNAGGEIEAINAINDLEVF